MATPSSGSGAPAALCGLLLAGGRGSRMSADKGLLAFGGRTQLESGLELLRGACGRAFVALRPGQHADSAALPRIDDAFGDAGPLGGVLSAMILHPGFAWLVIACDLPFLSGDALRALAAARDPSCAATAFRGPGGMPEPLCAIYEPAAAAVLTGGLAAGDLSLIRLLARHRVKLVEPPEPGLLANVNTPEEYKAAIERIRRV